MFNFQCVIMFIVVVDVGSFILVVVVLGQIKVVVSFNVWQLENELGVMLLLCLMWCLWFIDVGVLFYQCGVVFLNVVENFQDEVWVSYSGLSGELWIIIMLEYGVQVIILVLVVFVCCYLVLWVCYVFFFYYVDFILE